MDIVKTIRQIERRQAYVRQEIQPFVPLGLLDYVNPILYTVTMTTIIRNIYSGMSSPFNRILFLGALISIFFGFIIPTGKVIVGLGLIRFVMPVPLVFCVNAGIFLSGMMLLQHVLDLKPAVLLMLFLLAVIYLAFVYRKSRKANTIAVLTGAIGYLLIYSSLILLSLRKAMTVPVILYALAILLFVMLCGIGINWVIEISNVLCQFLVTLSSVLLFK